MYKVGVVGDKDSILGFKALGMSVFPTRDSWQFAKDIVSTIDKYKDHKLPAIIKVWNALWVLTYFSGMNNLWITT